MGWRSVSDLRKNCAGSGSRGKKSIGSRIRIRNTESVWQRENKSKLHLLLLKVVSITYRF
jgi:hypothetical protein